MVKYIYIYFLDLLQKSIGIHQQKIIRHLRKTIKFKDSLLFCGCLFSKSAPCLSHSSLRSALEMCKTISIPTKRAKIHFAFIILLNGSRRFSNILIVACFSSTLRRALNWKHNWTTHAVLPAFILSCFHWPRLLICIYKQSFSVTKCKNRYSFRALSDAVVLK